ncbi:MAG: OmpA family protein [Acidobacteriota bacterium]
MKFRTLSAAVFAVALAMSMTACKKKVPAPPPPPPPTKVEEPPPPAPAARITNFNVEPRTIQTGQSATLTWSVANATDISIDSGIGSVAANGTRQVFPTSTTTYTLTARAAGGNDTRSVTVDVSAPPPPPPPLPPPPKVSGIDMFNSDIASAGEVLFDYDKSDIRDDARQVLTHDADALKRIFAADPSFTVVLEGHCDERGSAEYNLGLGDRRSTAAKDFLVQLGVPAEKVRTISYGKDRPICTDASEACYQRNRRAHLAPAQ